MTDKIDQQVEELLPALNILFDGPPSHNAGRFVEVELDSGKGVNAGEWIKREGVLWALRINRAPAVAARLRELGQVIEQQRQTIDAFLTERAAWGVTQCDNLELKEEIERLKMTIQVAHEFHKSRFTEINPRDDEIHSLRSQLAEARQMLNRHHHCILETNLTCLVCAWRAADWAAK